ncbi:Enhancer of polycomb-like protein 1 [Grifola frondosa]|uniref:Enhancer of polycomb-like protein n=1 Tax=Grifola frondosa TaxID=5627 RepID=A0A1C7MPT3_GRIFR|nr:Enhancer of polycomb-like protein 1 [Grifola frondosa]
MLIILSPSNVVDIVIWERLFEAFWIVIMLDEDNDLLGSSKCSVYSLEYRLHISISALLPRDDIPLIMPGLEQEARRDLGISKSGNQRYNSGGYGLGPPKRHSNRCCTERASRRRPTPPSTDLALRQFFSHFPPPLHDMPRAHAPAPSTLRNRNRVTNKTRLKVIQDVIDADSIVLDEDEEKARVVSTAGVDAEDANEHHLQAVLSAAATRHQATYRSTRSEKASAAPAAYIPTPDSTGVVDNYAELYPSDRWKDPTTYVKSSDTVEEATSFALVNGFIYYMDERDKDWLDKNNEEARGEGTSAQGALSVTSTRSGRSAKAKGKEPDVGQPVSMSEDEFELVMAIFEKITHEKTEFLHHGLEQGSPFPPFSDYQDTFAVPIQPSMFALFSVPSWIPQPASLLRYARVVYPYWRERRLERGGHRIIPTVNLDETDTKNESYICFRRREIKAIRKTRAQQTTFSDKMFRLQAELATTLEMAKVVAQREVFKRDASVHGHELWEKRLALVDLKRHQPSLSTKEDEELLYDKERVPKKPKMEISGRIPIKIRTRDNGDASSPVTHGEPQVRPKERALAIQSQIEQEMNRQKEKDQAWENVIDNAYQPPPVPWASRQFKFIMGRASSSSSTDSESEQPARQCRAGRLRFGRGGRLHFDRRIVDHRPSSLTTFGRRSEPQSLFDETEDDLEAQDRARRLNERWKFDSDDLPAVGPGGADEQDRVLIDEYNPRYLTHYMTLLSEQDYQTLATDPSIVVSGSDGRPMTVPIKLVAPIVYPPRRDQLPSRHVPSPLTVPGISSMNSSNGSPLSVPGSSSGTPIAVSTQLKKMAPPNGLAHMRISSGGGMRLPSTSASSNVPANGLSTSSPHNTPPMSASLTNGFHDANGHSVEDQDTKSTVQGSPHGPVTANGDRSHEATVPSVPSSSPVPPSKLQTPTATVTMPNLPNGYHISSNAYSAVMPNGSPFPYSTPRHNGLTLQQMQNLKSVLSMSPTPDVPMQTNNVNMALRPASYVSHVLPNGSNYAMPMSRQMQWAAVAQRSPSSADANGVEAQTRAPIPLARGVNMPVMNHALAQGRASPASAHIARLTPHSPSPHMLSPSLTPQVHSSPTRTPQPSLASPSLQSRQVVGSSGRLGISDLVSYEL